METNQILFISALAGLLVSACVYGTIHKNKNSVGNYKNCKTYAYNFEASDSTKAGKSVNLNILLMSKGTVLVSDTLAAR